MDYNFDLTQTLLPGERAMTANNGQSNDFLNVQY